MKILKLKISNFLTIGEAEINLDDRGLLLIQGENEDDSSATSNGAGKSSIVDAISWCFFGVTARNKSGDGVVNREAKKDCCVQIDIQDGDDLYQIDRYRKSSSYKNQLVVSKHSAGTMIDMSKGTDKETQEIVNKIIGCSADVFNSAIYFGQERMPDLPNMTDKELKALIEEAAGVEVLTLAFNVAKVNALEEKNSLDVIESKCNSLREGIEEAKEELRKTKVEQAAFESGRVGLRDEALANALVESNERSGWQKALDKLDTAALTSRQAQLVAEISGLKAKREGLEKKSKELGGLQRLAAQAGERVNVARKQLNKLIDELKSIETKVGTPCGECGKSYCEHDLEAAKSIKRAAIEAAKTDLAAVKLLHDNAETSLSNFKEVLEKEAKKLEDPKALMDELEGNLKKLNNADIIKTKIEGCEKMHAKYMLDADAAMKAPNPFDALIAAVILKVEKREQSLLDSTAKLEAALKSYALAQDAVKVFGSAGVRAHILDTVTPFLNDRTRDYASDLSDGNIHAVWTTLTKTAKGELREKFSIEASNDKGDDTFAGLSGGEKRKVRLACAMALQDLVSSRATKPFSLLVADEVDDALDEAGLERLMGVLERKARDRGTVLVISHRSLSDWIPNVITVTKKSGKSVVSGAIAKA